MSPRLLAGSLLVALALSLSGCGSVKKIAGGDPSAPDLVSQSVEGTYAASLGLNATLGIDFDADAMRLRADARSEASVLTGGVAAEFGLLLDASTKKVTWSRAGACHWKAVPMMPPAAALKMSGKLALRKQQSGTDGDLRKFERKIENVTLPGLGKTMNLDVTAEMDKSNLLHNVRVIGDVAGLPVTGVFNASSTNGSKPGDEKFLVPSAWGACKEATNAEATALLDAAPLSLRAAFAAMTGLDLAEALAAPSNCSTAECCNAILDADQCWKTQRCRYSRYGCVLAPAAEEAQGNETEVAALVI